MAGRIRDEDIALVREKTPIADIIGEHVQLRNAGGGNLKGICPFHDEKSPSLSVSPSRGLYHCLAGETRVVTDAGSRPISELAGSTARVLTTGGRWVDAPFYDFGVQPLWEIVLRRNGRLKSVFATAQHRWFLRHDVPGREQGAERVTRQLRAGQALASSAAADRPELVSAAAGAAGPAPTALRRDNVHDRRPVRAAGDERHWVVVSVAPSDRIERVYCAVVERTHAFVLDDDILTGNCFGCGAGGDVIRFVQHIEHVDFSEAVEKLAGREGITLRYLEGCRSGRRANEPASLRRTPRHNSSTPNCCCPRTPWRRDSSSPSAASTWRWPNASVAGTRPPVGTS